MAANLQPITSDGGFTSGGNINSSGDPSAAPSLNDFFSVTSAANFAIVTDNANTDQTWTFGTDGTLTVPYEGVIRSNDDTIVLQSYDTPNLTSRSMRLGTNGALYLEETNPFPFTIPTWLTIENNSGNAVISAGDGIIGNIDGKNLSIAGGDAIQSGVTGSGGNVNITGGLGRDDGFGAGGPGGSVNISAGLSTDPAGNAGNVVINIGGSNNWTFDYTGNLGLPGNTFAVNYANGTQVSLGGGGLPLSNGNSIINIASVDGNITLDANGNIFTFGTDSNLTTPSNLVIGPRPGGGSLLLQNDAALDIIGEGSNAGVTMGWAANLSAPSSIALIGMNSIVGGGVGNIVIAVGNNASTVNTWLFGNDGNLTLPSNAFAINYANGTQVSIPTVGNIASINLDGNVSNLLTGNGTYVAIPSVGNIATINLDGSNSNVLYGNGVFAVVAAPTVTQDITSNGAMSIMTYDGNIKYVNYATVEPSSGNIAGGNLLTAGLISATSTITSAANVVGGNITTVGLISATGNVTGGNISTVGLVTATGNVTGGNIRTVGLMTATGNVTGGNLLTAGLISATSTITSAANVVGGNISTAGLVTATGNVIGGNIRTVGLISATGNVTGGNITTAGLISATGAITGAALTGTSLAVSTGNITGGNLLLSGAITDSGQLDIQTSASNANIVLTPNGTGNVNTGANVSVTGNVQAGNVRTAGLVSATGNVTGGNVLTAGLISATSTITSAANVVGGNITTIGLISATGNVTGNFILGNGSQLTGIVASSGNSIINGNSNVVVSANSNVTVGVTGTAVATFATTGEYVNGVISASGNITGGNVLTAGLISSTGNIIGGNITSSNFIGTNANVSLVAGLNTWTFDNTGSLTLPGNTIDIKYANTTSVPFLGVPSWTDSGNISFSGTGSDPSFPSSGVSINKLYYRQIGPKTWQVQARYQTSTASGGSAGVGDYFLRLPLGMSFDTSVATQTIFAGSGTSVVWPYTAIPDSTARYYFGGTSESGWDGGIVVASTTTYRVVIGANGGTTYQPWGQTFAAVTLSNLAVVWSFTFQVT
jgi:hypothetical protein